MLRTNERPRNRGTLVRETARVIRVENLLAGLCHGRDHRDATGSKRRVPICSGRMTSKAAASGKALCLIYSSLDARHASPSLLPRAPLSP